MKEEKKNNQKTRSHISINISAQPVSVYFLLFHFFFQTEQIQSQTYLNIKCHLLLKRI